MLPIQAHSGGMRYTHTYARMSANTCIEKIERKRVKRCTKKKKKNAECQIRPSCVYSNERDGSQKCCCYLQICVICQIGFRIFF